MKSYKYFDTILGSQLAIYSKVKSTLLSPKKGLNIIQCKKGTYISSYLLYFTILSCPSRQLEEYYLKELFKLEFPSNILLNLVIANVVGVPKLQIGMLKK